MEKECKNCYHVSANLLNCLSDRECLSFSEFKQVPMLLGSSPVGGSGIKHDDGKQRWDLLPLEAVNEIVKIYTFGAKKYKANSWQNVDKDRYFSALMRHLVAYRKGERFDEESGELHTAHIGWNALALIWNDLQEEEHGTLQK